MIGREMLGSGMPSSFASGVAGFGLTVAAAGSTQTDAALIQTSMAIVTGADGTKGVVLLGGVEGDEVWIVNNSASTLKVYPPTGAAISVPGTGLGSANAAFLLTGNATFHGKFESTTQVIASSTAAYAEGNWTPTDASGAGLTITVIYAKYTKWGRVVFLSAGLAWPATANASVAKLGGAPFTAADIYLGAANGQTGNASAAVIQGTNITFNTDASAQLTNANLSGSVIRFSVVYTI